SGGPFSSPLSVSFQNLEPVDISGMASATVVSPANSSNALVLNAGVDSSTGTHPAIIVSGTTGAVGIESAQLFNNTNVFVDTSATSGAGANTVTVSGPLSLGLNNTNLTLKTNANGSVTVNAGAAVAGTLSVLSPTANLNADLSGVALTGTATTVNVIPS